MPPLAPAGASPYGHPLSTNTGGTATRAAVSVATIAALAALASTHPACTHGNEMFVDADGSRFRYHSTSALTADSLLVVTPSDSPAAGRWLRCTGQIRLALPIAFGTADAAVLFTVPTGAEIKINDLFWEITADFTGGSSSAIGVSSAKTGFSTKGDLLGGAAGDVAATITAALSPAAGTAGAKMDTLAEVRAAIFKAADTIRFDRITSAFTAGAGNVVLVGQLTKNAGA